MKIALVHEYLTQLGGAERVLRNFLDIWPDATIHALVADPGKIDNEFESYQKRLSFLNSWPWAKRHHKLYLTLMPWAVESFKFEDFDLVLSDSSSFAKGAKANNKLHICYCHTPTRFLWTNPEYLGKQDYPGILKLAGKVVLPWLKKWDYKAAQRPDFFIANSRNVQNRIQKYYNRNSTVVYPPVDTVFFKPTQVKGDYFFTASRLEPYKRMDLVVSVFNELGTPLKIAGTGTQFEYLKRMAKPNIEFLGRVSDQDLRNLYSGAQAFIFPAEEDAGIMMLEAQACGTPVIAFGRGGALELVKENETGIFFDQQTTERLKFAIANFNHLAFDPVKIRDWAKQFDKQIFQSKIKQFVQEKYSQRSSA